MHWTVQRTSFSNDTRSVLHFSCPFKSKIFLWVSQEYFTQIVPHLQILCFCRIREKHFYIYSPCLLFHRNLHQINTKTFKCIFFKQTARKEIIVGKIAQAYCEQVLQEPTHIFLPWHPLFHIIPNLQCSCCCAWSKSPCNECTFVSWFQIAWDSVEAFGL